jgi:hypothetical protein
MGWAITALLKRLDSERGVWSDFSDWPIKEPQTTLWNWAFRS